MCEKKIDTWRLCDIAQEYRETILLSKYQSESEVLWLFSIVVCLYLLGQSAKSV